MNYPPGMKESDIPGWGDHEVEVETTCTATNVEIEVLRDLSEIASLMRQTKMCLESLGGKSNPPHTIPFDRRAIQYLDTAMRLFANDRTKVTVNKCPYSGYTEIVTDGSPQDFDWDCPFCGTVNEGFFGGYEEDY
jgi:hypothetical protein